MRLSQEHKEALLDFMSAGGLRALEAVLDAQTQEFERAVVSLAITCRDDEYRLAARRHELEGARKVRTGVLTFLNSLRRVRHGDEPEQKK